MFRVVSKTKEGPDVFRFWIEAPRVAKARRAGQFAIVRVDEMGERIPLTIADVDCEQGTVSLIVQKIGYSTGRLCELGVGDAVRDLVGPLGKATEIEKFGHAVVVGGGVGTAVVYPQAVALKEAGNRVTAITGGRTKGLVLLESALREVVDEVIVCTDDGSYGRKGFVTSALEALIAAGDPAVDVVFTAGPGLMMKAVTAVTRAQGIKTLVSLNPIMVDGTGMCGGCRVTVGGQMRFACVDGPEFDGHAVDFDELAGRLVTYRVHEQDFSAEHRCRLDEAVEEGHHRAPPTADRLNNNSGVI